MNVTYYLIFSYSFATALKSMSRDTDCSDSLGLTRLDLKTVGITILWPHLAAVMKADHKNETFLQFLLSFTTHSHAWEGILHKLYSNLYGEISYGEILLPSPSFL